jgi:hypothetical protein
VKLIVLFWIDTVDWHNHIWKERDWGGMSAAFKVPAVHDPHEAHEEARRDCLPAVRIPFPVADLGASALPFLAPLDTVYGKLV